MPHKTPDTLKGPIKDNNTVYECFLCLAYKRGTGVIDKLLSPHSISGRDAIKQPACFHDETNKEIQI